MKYPRNNHVAVLVAAACWLVTCQADRGIVVDTEGSSSDLSASPAMFVDQAEELGVVYRHEDGRSGQRYYVETASGGGGWLDFDLDGDLDLFLINGAALPGRDLEVPAKNALYVQEGDSFVERGVELGFAGTGYGMGLCVGDVDSDGWPDVLVTNFGANRLYRNLGTKEGVARGFEEVSLQWDLRDSEWSTGCAFADLDGDRDLDLYVVNYLDYEPERNRVCGDRARGLSSYCRPDVFAGVPDRLYLNEGGRFVDRSAERGLALASSERGFAVVAFDLEEDGDLDLVVTNDGSANRLYRNAGGAVFEDIAVELGVAVAGDGGPESSMGLAVADLDGDLAADLLISNYVYETNTYLRGEPSRSADALPWFSDDTLAVGLAQHGFLSVGWGLAAADFDLDGRLDLAIANGHVMDNIREFDASASWPQPNTLLLGEGEGSSLRLRGSERSAPGFTDETARVSRALATGDWNDDGLLDLLVVNAGGAPRLLRNVFEREGSDASKWAGVRLMGPPHDRLALGAVVDLLVDGQRRQRRRVDSGGSYLSQNDLRAHFGLGSIASAARLEVEVSWANGQGSEIFPLVRERYVDAVFGAGRSGDGLGAQQQK